MSNCPTILAIEIGGSHVRRTLSSDGTIYQVYRQPVPRTFQDLCQFIEEGCFDKDGKSLGVSAIGIASAHYSVNELNRQKIGWLKDFNVQALQAGKVNVPIFLFNRLQAAAVGINHLDRIQGSFAVWHWGKSVDFWADGCEHPNETIGHENYVPANPKGEAPICTCGAAGHTRAYLSGEFIDERLMEANTAHELCWIRARDEFGAELLWAQEFYLYHVTPPAAAFLCRLYEAHPVDEVYIRGGFGESLPLITPFIKEAIRDLGHDRLAEIPIKVSPSKADALIGTAILAQAMLA